MEKDHWQWPLRSIGLSLGFQLLVLVRLYRRMARYEKRGQNSLIHAVTARMQLPKVQIALVEKTIASSCM